MSNNLRALRTKAGLSAREVAEAIDVSPGAYRNWENDECSISSPNLLKLSDFFGVPIEFLLIENPTVDSNSLGYVRVSHVEVQVLNAFRSCSEKGKAFFLEQAQLISRAFPSESMTLIDE